MKNWDKDIYTCSGGIMSAVEARDFSEKGAKLNELVRIDNLAKAIRDVTTTGGVDMFIYDITPQEISLLVSLGYEVYQTSENYRISWEK